MSGALVGDLKGSNLSAAFGGSLRRRVDLNLSFFSF